MVDMFSKWQIVKDGGKVSVLFTVTVIASVAINGKKSDSLQLDYLPQDALLDKSVKVMAAPFNSYVESVPEISLKEMNKIRVKSDALILDARPEIFYRFGHIPSALSLPRDDFKARYISLVKIFTKYKDKNVIVYCSSSSCQDSLMVAKALAILGFQNVQIFRGGWIDWKTAELPEEE